MSYYKTCPDCGANLDPGEVCECECRPIARITICSTPMPFIGCTMTDEREKEITRTAALRNMHKFGLEPCEANLPEYFRRAREALA